MLANAKTMPIATFWRPSITMHQDAELIARCQRADASAFDAIELQCVVHARSLHGFQGRAGLAILSLNTEFGPGRPW